LVSPLIRPTSNLKEESREHEGLRPCEAGKSKVRRFQ
jgi:hypothetical protein